MLRYAETPEKIVVFFTETTFHSEPEIQEAGDGLVEILSLAATLGLT